MEWYKNEEHKNRWLDVLFHTYLDLQQGNVWFVGSEIMGDLGFYGSQQLIEELVDHDDRINMKLRKSGHLRNCVIINESALYVLVYKSTLPKYANEVKWSIANKVIPKIRSNVVFPGNSSPITVGRSASELWYTIITQARCKNILRMYNIHDHQKI